MSNWHPIFVQFSVASLVIATVMLAVAADQALTSPRDQLQIAGRSMFWIGAVMLMLTGITGLQTYYASVHVGSPHRAMTEHENWALWIFATIIPIAAVMWIHRSRALPPLALALLFFLTGLVLAAYIEAENSTPIPHE